MPRISFVLILFVLFNASAAAQSRPELTGQVVDAQSGKPVADAVITIPGAAGTSKTDREGRFVWNSPPSAPFQVIVILPGGQVARPVDVTAIDPAGLTITVSSLADEAVTVVGAAPSIVTAPAAGKTMLSPEQISSRSPENLTQALETVPGVNVVSEGHASVPAIRGLARGRTLVLIDGARVSSERRVGPSATFADPAAFDGRSGAGVVAVDGAFEADGRVAGGATGAGAGAGAGSAPSFSTAADGCGAVSVAAGADFGDSSSERAHPASVSASVSPMQFTKILINSSFG